MVALGIAGACGKSRAEPSGPATPRPLTPVAATSDWPSATAASQNLDIPMLETLNGRLNRGDFGSITSLIIARNGQLVVEEYFGGWNAAQPHTMQSVTKSVTSILTGIAVDRGRLNISSRVVDVFPDYAPIANLDANKQAMTVRDLLRMQAGMNWSERQYAGSPLEQLNTCKCDWYRFLLDWPMLEPPGARWEYNSGASILIGAVLGRSVGMPIYQWATAELWPALDVQGQFWFVSSVDAQPHTGGGLNLRPRDAAKIGQLVLGNGRWRGQQLVSSAWIAESTTPSMFSVSTFGSRPGDYGYQWWRLPGGVITAAGSRGQWIFIAPDKNLVVASTAEADADFLSAPDFLYSYILPAAR